MKRGKLEYEADVATLVGKQLKGVRYFEIRKSSDVPCYLNHAFSGHLLDYGCDLEMTDGSIFAFFWDDEYFQYGVGITRTSLATQLSDARVWDVSDDDHWAGLIGQTITNAKVYWSWVEVEGSSERHTYPQDIQVEFSNRSLVFFSASQYDEEKDALLGMSDEIAVIFGVDASEKHRIGPFAERR